MTVNVFFIGAEGELGNPENFAIFNSASPASFNVSSNTIWDAHLKFGEGPRRNVGEKCHVFFRS